MSTFFVKENAKKTAHKLKIFSLTKNIHNLIIFHFML